MATSNENPPTPLKDKPQKGGRRRSFPVQGELLRSSRIERGWSQKEASVATGLSEKTIRTAESGGSLQQQSIETLARVYRVPLAAIGFNHPLSSNADAEPRQPLSGSAANAKRYLEGVWNHGRLELIDELFLPAFHFHHESGTVQSRDEMRQRIIELRRSFSEIDFAVEQVSDHGEFIACRWRAEALHSGTWIDLAPTLRRIVIHGSSWAQVVGGLFGDCWDFWDPALLYRQLSEPAVPP